MNTITRKQITALEDKIYSTLMGISMYDDNGEEITFGMGEMGECRETAQNTVSEWMEAEGIIEKEVIESSKIDTLRSILVSWNKDGQYTNLLDLLTPQ